MKKTYAFLAVVGLFVAGCTQTIYPENVLAGDALTERLTNTKLVLRPVVEGKPRKGAVTQFVVKMLPSGESTWESNGRYPRETLSHWQVRGNMLCLEDPNRRFRDAARRKKGLKVIKRPKNAGCSVVAIQGDLITLHAPQSSHSNTKALTGRIGPL